jgi:hypothetical protein
MTEAITEGIQSFLVRDLKAFMEELRAYPDDATPWLTLPGVSNSAANLALHVAGNLQHFVGGILGQSGYVRDRQLEFSRRAGTREEVVQELARALDAVERVLPGLSPETLAGPFPVELDGKTYPVEVFLLRLSLHLTYHLGQANYLRRILVIA